MILKRVSDLVAYYEDGLKLVGLNQEEINKVKEDLTFKNPAYARTQRYSRYNSTNIPPYLNYYKEGRDFIEVPVGYSIPFPVGQRVDNRVTNKVEVPPFILELRDDQKEAAESYLDMNKRADLKGSIQMPTGKGKSILGLYLASKLSTKTLIVVHKDDLVTGWNKDIKLAFNNKVKSGLIKAKSRKIGDFITVATIQTLNRLSEEELRVLFNQFGFVIQDECHHCPATSFGTVARFKARYKLGLTATPERTDGLEHVISLYFGGFCYVYKHDENDEDILPVSVLPRTLNYYFDPLCQEYQIKGRKQFKIKDLEYEEKGTIKDNQCRLSEVPYDVRPRVPFHTIDDLVVRNIIEEVCRDIYNEYSRGRSCVVFFTQKEHCRIYQDYLVEELKVAEKDIGLYYGDNTDNEAVKELAENQRKYITLTTYAKATEGTNVKQWEVEFLVSSLNNGKNVEQAVGRVRRTKEGKKIDTAIVYDYRFPRVYSFASHSRTRDKRYRDLKFNIEGVQKRGLFSRGY